MSSDNKSSQEIAIEILKDEEKNDEQKMDSTISNNKELSPSPSLDNGLDPIGIELISSTIDVEPSIEDESSEMMETLSEDKEATTTTDVSTEISADGQDVVKAAIEVSVSNSSFNDETISAPKMSREMRNLQKSTQDSKVLSNYLTEADSPRIRRKTLKESSATELDTTFDSSITTTSMTDKEVPLKGGTPDNEDSDSTVVVRDDNVEKKRRRSVSRSRTSHRSKSVASRSRPKSLSRMLSDEMAATSDKDDNREDDDMDDLNNVAASTQPIENRAPNPPPKPGWDSFCFKCHLDSAVLSLACSKCKCSFHRHCARLLNTPIKKNDDFICADCIEIEKIQQSTVNKYNHPKIDLHTLKDMLMTVLEKIRTYPDRECYENDIQFKSTKESTQPLIITQISLKTIEDRIRNNFYKVSEAFLHDVKQLEHNWTLIDKNKTKSLKNILKFVVTEINEMEACVHCYSSSYVISNWFTIPCKRPHLLIWAKLKGYPYWPAKVMSIDNQKQYADVRFFGAHDRAWVPTPHCLLFSEKDPNKQGKTTAPATTPSNKPTSKSQKGLADAMKEKDEYIQNIREKYGFRYAATRENLEPDTFQQQLEYQLPSWKAAQEKSESDHIQKEKLTLKIVKKSDGSQIIEQKTPKIGQEKDKNILYRVLSKNDDEGSDQSRVKAIILKRNTQSDSEKGRSKKSNVDDSETSESNLSLQEGKISAVRRKSLRDVSRKTGRNTSSRSVTPEPSKKKPKPSNVTDESGLLEEMPERPAKKPRKSILHEKETPSVISNNKPKVPTGTHEIHTLRESPILRSSKNRSQSFNRSKSFDKESLKSNSSNRRLSANSVASSTRASSIASSKSAALKSQSRRTPSQSRSGTSTPIRKRSNSNATPVVHPEFNPNLVIKDEPVTDEEVVQRNQVTINDIADLVGDRNASKRKTILISTSDNSNDSFPQNSRARKTFPNSLPVNRLQDALQAPQIKNTNAMVCIPKIFPTEVRVTQEPVKFGTVKIANGTHEPANVERTVTPSSTSQPTTSQTSVTTTTTNLNDINSSLRHSFQYPDLPRMVPKPTGVFSNEGNTFQRESGAVAALFSENAHRMTDYFKSLLIDTIGAIASGVSDAQNVLLKLEVEKMKQTLNNIKMEHQMKIDKLKKEHADEIKALKDSNDDKIKQVQLHSDQEKLRLIAEIRQQCELEKQRAIEATKREVKRVTWCSNCPKEARFYCCWNTSYCGQTCQKNHWQNHLKFCTNRNSSVESNLQNTSNINTSSNNNGNRQQNASEIASTSPSPAQSVPVTISIAYPNNRQILRTIAVPKQASPQLIAQQQQAGSTMMAPAVTPQHDTTHQIRSPAQHTIIQAGQKTIISPLMPTSYVMQQHKIPSQVPSAALKAISSTLATEQSLTSGLANSLVVRTIARNNSPPMTVISAANKTINHLNDIITTTSIINNPNSALMSPPHSIISNNGSIISHVSSASPK